MISNIDEKCVFCKEGKIIFPTFEKNDKLNFGKNKGIYFPFGVILLCSNENCGAIVDFQEKIRKTFKSEEEIKETFKSEKIISKIVKDEKIIITASLNKNEYTFKVLE